MAKNVLTKPLPERDLVSRVLSYNPETGVFTWLVDMSRIAKKGDTAGYISERGYRRICVGGKLYMAHRLALLVSGVDVGDSDEVDHIDHDKLNNRLANLRVVGREGNNRNAARRKDNSSGVTGVQKMTNCDLWKARIGIGGGKDKWRLFRTMEEAVACRREWERELGYSVSHGEKLS